MADEIRDHVVAMTVFISAKGVDANDAGNVAEQAIKTPGVVRTHAGIERFASIIKVTRTDAALRNGELVPHQATFAWLTTRRR